MPYYPQSTAQYTYTAANRGLLAENYPINFANGNTVQPTAGRIEFAKIRLPNAASVTNIVMLAVTAGGTLTSGQCFAVLYNSAGVRVGVTADQAASWATNGVKTMALAGGPFACAPGDYFVAFWFNGTTGVAWARCTAQNAAAINLGVATPNLFFGSADTGQTTTSPSPMGAQTVQATSWWVALS